jgi:hypothetical protein
LYVSVLTTLPLSLLLLLCVLCSAALTIAFVRGFSLNFGVYYAVRESLNIPFRWNPIVLFITR